jgi:hypothetical protein
MPATARILVFELVCGLFRFRARPGCKSDRGVLLGIPGAEITEPKSSVAHEKAGATEESQALDPVILVVSRVLPRIYLFESTRQVLMSYPG